MTRFVSLSIVPLALIGALALPSAAQARDRDNRSVESVHQPVVSYAAYTFDVMPGVDGALSEAEAQRTNDWLVSIGVGYGDQVSIVTDAGTYSPALRDGVADVVARHGLLVGEDSSAAAGLPADGSARLIVRRAIASVPGCPDWRSKAETNMNLGTSSNYGCGINSNLAAMVANPEDLVRGQASESGLRTATSNRAISTYRDKQPTGSGDLKTLSGGN
ncbi:MAG: CpaD family pilus assembly lipoprotein [Sphingobium sp.]|nr:CpaD family pilus assembly lipoprotein [Sphingobium sp.]